MFSKSGSFNSHAEGSYHCIHFGPELSEYIGLAMYEAFLRCASFWCFSSSLVDDRSTWMMWSLDMDPACWRYPLQLHHNVLLEETENARPITQLRRLHKKKIKRFWRVSFTGFLFYYCFLILILLFV
jgi:hypothetical protein